MRKKITNKGKIGFFDSGFGGLHILRAIVHALPAYDYIYLGDTARAPYGARTKEVVHQFTEQAVDFLFRNNCELVIIACNTASSDALHTIQQEYLGKKHPEKRVLGVLIPAAEEAVKSTKTHRVGVIATTGTVRSCAFIREIKKLPSKTKVFQNSAPLLVPIIEEGEYNSKATQIFLTKYLHPLLQKKIDTLILGCTHYGIIESKIKKICGNNITIISEARIVPKKLKEYLNRHSEIDEKLSKNGSVVFYTTDLTEKFVKLGSKFFGKPINVKKIENL